MLLLMGALHLQNTDTLYIPSWIAVGVPAFEEIIYDSTTSRRVFKGKWLVNGTEWPGPYLDLDIMGWPIGESKPQRWPWADGRCPSGVSRCPFDCPTLYKLWLTGPNGGPLYLDDFAKRYGGYERVPWMRGVTVIRVSYKTTLEPVYEREYFVSFRMPEGLRVIEGNTTGWYREGSRIVLPRLTELQVSKGTKLLYEWRDDSGRVYRPGEEVIVDGPKSFEPVPVSYHLVSVKGPKELKHEGSGWYREGSTARLRVVENVTYVSDATRYVFLGFKVGNEIVRDAEIKVEGPVEVEAVWRREHLLTVKSRFLDWTFTNSWFKENTTYTIVIPGGLQDLGNGTMIEVNGVEVLSGGRRFVAERLDLPTINMTIGGRRTTILWNATFTVHGPIEMRILWKVKYALQISAPPGVASIRGSSVQLPTTVFIEEGERVTLDFNTVQLTNDTARLVLHDVIIDNRSLGPRYYVEIEISKPVKLDIVPNGQGRLSASLIGASEQEVAVPPGEHTVVLPVSPYTIAIIASLITPTYMVVVRRERQRS
jgi:hypothetical protein